MKRMKFTIPALLILLLANTGCNKTNDIRGTWSFHITNPEGYLHFTFSGSSEFGTLFLANLRLKDWQRGTGNYTVVGDHVVFNFDPTLFGGLSCIFNGSFATEDKLLGTMKISMCTPSPDWTEEVEGRRL